MKIKIKKNRFCPCSLNIYTADKLITVTADLRKK